MENQKPSIDPNIDLEKLIEAGKIMDRLFGDIEDMADMDASYFVDHAGDIFKAGYLAGRAFDKTNREGGSCRS